MGLYGALVVRPSAGANLAYDAATQFDPSREYLLLLAEIDPDLHHAVEIGATYDFNARTTATSRSTAALPRHDPGQRLGPAAQPAVRRARADPAEHDDQHAAGAHPDDQRRRATTTRSTRTATTRPRSRRTDACCSAPVGTASTEHFGETIGSGADRGLPAALGRPGPLEPGHQPVPGPAAELPQRDVQGRQHLVQRQPVPRLQGHAPHRHDRRRTSAVSGTSRCTATR